MKRGLEKVDSDNFYNTSHSMTVAVGWERSSHPTATAIGRGYRKNPTKKTIIKNVFTNLCELKKTKRNQAMQKNPPTVLMLGCFDTKAEDFTYLYQCLSKTGLQIITLNTGVRGTTEAFPVDLEAAEVASQTDWTIQQLLDKNDRGIVVEKMGAGAAKLITQLVADGKIQGAIGMGGGGGTYIALSAMQGIPIGMPKLCLSTVASKDLSRQVGTKDIVLMPSVVDVAGLNSVSRLLISQAAGAINGMIQNSQIAQADKVGTIAISIFGNTTPCVEKCTEILKEKGYEVLAFHSVGTGGLVMESLIREGFFDGVLDITTTELADDLCEGICSAGPDRLTAASQKGIPQVVVPGCLDMVNYGHLDTVPERFKSRNLYSWAPDVTLMRTNAAENKILGESIANKLNQSTGKVSVLLPLKGISIVSSEGGVFYDPEVDTLLFDTIKKKVQAAIPVTEIAANINDPIFAEKAVKLLLGMIGEEI